MESVLVPGEKPVRLLQWLVKVGDWLKYGTPVAIYRCIEDPSTGVKSKEMELKSRKVGKVKKFAMEVGQVAKPGGMILEMEACSHPVVMKDMCAECGVDLRMVKRRCEKQAHVSMIPSVPELKISKQQAEEIGNQDKSRLHKLNKLVLLVDLDQTLIHTTQNQAFAAMCSEEKDFFTFQLHKNEPTLYTKLRPYCREFLQEISKCYELQVVTFGSRLYAHKIAEFIDPKKKFFANRILSRDECINPMKKSGNLRHLFPCGDSMVCIIDDRDDVWSSAPNLVMVKKYSYFPGSGDINSPDKVEAKKQTGDTAKSETSKEVDKPQEVETESPAVDNNSNNTRKRKSETDENDKSSKIMKNSHDGCDENEQKVKEKIIKQTNNGGNKKVECETKMECNNDADKPEVMIDASKNKEEEDEKNDNSEDVVLSSDSESDSSSDSSSSSSGSENSKDQIAETNSVEQSCQVSTSASSTESNGTSNTDNTTASSKENIKNKSEINTDSTVPSDVVSICKTTTIDNGSHSATAVCQKKENNSQVLADHDDYLKYLQSILTCIHYTYYDAYKKHLNGEFEHPPDLRGVVPFLRSKVLYGCCIVLTGIIPNNFKAAPHMHRAHIVARQLGAAINSTVDENTTHLIGAKKGTAKYQDALKMGKKKIHMVSIEWLWACSDRWERVSEKLFPMPSKSSRHSRSRSGTPPVHKSVNVTPAQTSEKRYDAVTGKLLKKVLDPRFEFMVSEAVTRKQKRKSPLYTSLKNPEKVIPVQFNQSSNEASTSTAVSATRTRKPSMAEVMGIGYTLSSNDIEDMDKEVEDLMNSDEDDGDELGTKIDRPVSSSSESSLLATSSKPLNPDSILTKISESSSSSNNVSSSEEEFDHMAELLDHEMHYDEDSVNLDDMD
uniref:RNA polymerase II subunit A C-terminal domain phosphatase-like isoform X3 n=1 Tax=Ciona intestinalis TaxID=7719 RepID=UPI00089DCAAC|nr:RNA polymerase II subunit A C-terminal domain phosphatase-like isoform X3 [Ciona intestinalis]|eukprot:XP_018666687.1 RNA polymerase II subunit A C-terminal domain phosphatase-like isoform X3 [Ciona intestinalis]